jgi:hypothetical protein
MMAQHPIFFLSKRQRRYIPQESPPSILGRVYLPSEAGPAQAAAQSLHFPHLARETPNRAIHSPVPEAPETFLRLLLLVVAVFGERVGPSVGGLMLFLVGRRPREQTGYLSTQLGVAMS